MLIEPAPLGSARKTSGLRTFSDACSHSRQSIRQDPSANRSLLILEALRLKLVAAVRHE